MTVTITTESPYATGYYFTVGGVEEFKNATTYTKENFATPNEYKVSVYAKGGGFDEEGVYYVDSQAQGGSNTSKYMITLLSTPTDMQYIDGSFLKFEGSKYAEYGYTVEICVDGGAWQTVNTNAGTRVDVSSYITGATSVKFRVHANGQGSNVIASKTVGSQTWQLS